MADGQQAGRCRSLPAISEFFEGGINLTQTELAGKCFNTFIGDTRSSTSLTATIFDFSRGQLGGCGSELVTDPSVEGSVEINAAASVSVTDDADLTVTGAEEWSGTLSFFLCGPLAAGVTCDTGGVPSGVDIPVDQDTVMPVSSDASTVTVSAGTAGMAIHQCHGWRSRRTDASEGECFNVTPVTPTLTTSAGADVVLGNPITDTATLTGTANQPGDNGGSTLDSRVTPIRQSTRTMVPWRTGRSRSPWSGRMTAYPCQPGSRTLS